MEYLGFEAFLKTNQLCKLLFIRKNSLFLVAMSYSTADHYVKRQSRLDSQHPIKAIFAMTQTSTSPYDDESVAPLDQQESEDDIHLDRNKANDAVLFNTDWTVETIFRQIEKGNIDLDPQFQRREAWDADRKSKFIESIICSLPIPNIVLAEDRKRKGRYVVIDGKQRLFTISSFWKDEFKLKNLTIRDDLNGYAFAQLVADKADEVSALENYPIRTIIIRNWPNEDYLYTVFYRLNSGSLPLSPQELRKALHGGKLLDFLDEFVRSSGEFKEVFGDKVDPRMRDVELALRYVAFDMFYIKYSGNLKVFLDETVRFFDANWSDENSALSQSLLRLSLALKTTSRIFGADAFKKWNGSKFERRVNRAIFDVMTRYFSDEKIAFLADEKAAEVIAGFKDLCQENASFRNAVERTTKSPEATSARHVLWGKRLGEIVGATLDQTSMRLI